MKCCPVNLDSQLKRAAVGGSQGKNKENIYLVLPACPEEAVGLKYHFPKLRNHEEAVIVLVLIFEEKQILLLTTGRILNM